MRAWHHRPSFRPLPRHRASSTEQQLGVSSAYSPRAGRLALPAIFVLQSTLLTHVGFPPPPSRICESVRLRGDVAPLLSLPVPSASAGLAGLPLDGSAGALSDSVGTGISLRSSTGMLQGLWLRAVFNARFLLIYSTCSEA